MPKKTVTSGQAQQGAKSPAGAPAMFSYEASGTPRSRRETVYAAPGEALRTPSGIPVPPAWKNVWMTADPNGRLQATGRDTKGRRVYLYSAEQMGRAAAAKFARLKAFEREYPSLIRKVERDMKTREEAFVLYLIAKTGFRIGGPFKTLAEVRAYGASTLRCPQVSIAGNNLSFDFIGKKGIRVNKALKDAFLARGIDRRCNTGDDKVIFNTTDRDIRVYLESIQKEPRFMVKDFRTYLGTLTAFRKMRGMPVPRNDREFRSYRRRVGEAVAGELGNSPAIALRSYVAPEVFCAWESGEAPEINKQGNKRHSMADEFLECVHYGNRSS